MQTYKNYKDEYERVCNDKKLNILVVKKCGYGFIFKINKQNTLVELYKEVALMMDLKLNAFDLHDENHNIIPYNSNKCNSFFSGKRSNYDINYPVVYKIFYIPESKVSRNVLSHESHY